MFEKELKYVFHARFKSLLLQWLGAHCEVDPAFPENIVTSIYYDTADLAHLYEKRNSDYLKYKLRLRWYQGPGINEFSPVFAEVKRKEGSNRLKQRIPLDFDGKALQNISYSDPDLLAVPLRVKQEGLPISTGLKPIIQITYKRRRLTNRISQTRLNLDWDIRPMRASSVFLGGIDVGYLPVVICEVKGQASQLPSWMQNLTALGGRRRAFSKYFECYLTASRQHSL